MLLCCLQGNVEASCHDTPHRLVCKCRVRMMLKCYTLADGWLLCEGWGSGAKEEEKASSGGTQPASAAQPSQAAGQSTQSSAVVKVHLP